MTFYVNGGSLGGAATVRFTKDALRDVERLPAGIVPRVYALVERLGRWPAVSGAKPLRGELVNHYRLRTGDWRLIFRVAGEVVTVVRVANRRDVYEE